VNAVLPVTTELYDGRSRPELQEQIGPSEKHQNRFFQDLDWHWLPMFSSAGTLLLAL
jgi:hypothetical protein